ncbi:MAG: hypothetical protein O7E52_09135, partial [Candidatus Poribacteria bacterium]|nr:hypothetical protein [Candidatus Poribacteria bacterium]
RMTIGEFNLMFHSMKTLLHNGLLILGVFVVYREWSGGKIHWRHHEPSEGINAEPNSSLS